MTNITTAIYAIGAGNPTDVLRVGQIAIPELGAQDVHIRFLAASVNPSDMGAIKGSYPTPLGKTPTATTPTGEPIRGVPGFEGVAEVVALGAEAATTTHPTLASPTDASPYLSVGDWVIPFGSSVGSWRRDAVVPVKAVLRVPKTLSPAAAATLMVNPTTALRMLTDYVTLGQGDVVVQNAGNSAVGQYVGQISRARGYTCVSVVRDRPDFDATAVLLKSQGAAHVVRPADLAALVAAHPEWKVRLAFNAVGPAPEIISVLSPGAIFVTYGAMTSDPLAINPGLFIIKDLTLKGFWLSQWGKTAPAGAYRAMIDELIAMYGTGALQTPEFAEIVVAAENPDHKAIVDGIAAAGASFLGRKQLIVFQ